MLRVKETGTGSEELLIAQHSTKRAAAAVR